MKRNQLLKIGGVLFLSCFVLTGVFATGAEEEAKTYTIIFSHQQAIGSPSDEAAQYFKEKLEAATDGQVEVRVFPAAQMGSDEENFEGVKMGTVTMTFTNPDFVSNFIPEMAAMPLPFLFTSWDQVEAAFDGEVGAELSGLLMERMGILNLGWIHFGFRHMYTISKPLRKFDDLQNVKFRSPAIPVYVEMFKAIGANPTPIPWGEVYSAMKTKVVDGMETTPEGAVGINMWEVAEYAIKTGHLYTAGFMLMNNKFFEELPKDIQSKVEQIAHDAIMIQRKEQIAVNENAFNVMADNGMTVIDFEEKDKLQEACLPVWDELLKDAPPKTRELAYKIRDLGM